MRTAIDKFRLNIQRIRQLGELYKNINVQITSALDVSDILRSELVLAVSAFDFFIHEITRIGMLEIYQGYRLQTTAFLRFTVSLDQVLIGMQDPEKTQWLVESIIKQMSWQSFQHPDKVADAIRHISTIRLWDEVGNQLGMPAQQVKHRLDIIVDRRNKIAHQADMEHERTGLDELLDIDAAMVDDAIDFLEQVAEAIARVV